MHNKSSITGLIDEPNELRPASEGRTKSFYMRNSVEKCLLDIRQKYSPSCPRVFAVLVGFRQ